VEVIKEKLKIKAKEKEKLQSKENYEDKLNNNLVVLYYRLV